MAIRLNCSTCKCSALQQSYIVDQSRKLHIRHPLSELSCSLGRGHPLKFLIAKSVWPSAIQLAAFAGSCLYSISPPCLLAFASAALPNELTGEAALAEREGLGVRDLLVDLPAKGLRTFWPIFVLGEGLF